MRENCDRFKYPHTPYMDISGSVDLHDEVRSLDSFAWSDGRDVIVTEKMDGENTSVYADHIHARSLDSRHHDSRNWIKSYAAQYIQPVLAPGERVLVENVYARHSIAYNQLPSFAWIFGVFHRTLVADWDYVELMASTVGLPTVPVLYQGPFDRHRIESVIASLDIEHQEGIVVRSREAFDVSEFSRHIAKWVRPGHVQTDQHWTRRWVPNKMRGNAQR